MDRRAFADTVAAICPGRLLLDLTRGRHRCSVFDLVRSTAVRHPDRGIGSRGATVLAAVASAVIDADHPAGAGRPGGRAERAGPERTDEWRDRVRSTSPTLSVRVTDPDNNAMTVTFFGRPFASGNFAQIAQNTGVASGATTTTPWASLGAGQTFEWYRDRHGRNDHHDRPDLDLPDDRRAPTRSSSASVTSPSCSNTNDTDTGNVISGIDGNDLHDRRQRLPRRHRRRLHELLRADAVGRRGGQVADASDPGQPRLEHRATSTATTATSAPPPPTRTARATTATTSPAATGTSSTSTASAPGVTGGCTAGSPQELWLKADLAANSTKNVIALWHKPRYSSAATNLTDLQPLRRRPLRGRRRHRSDGHDHVYERIAQLNAVRRRRIPVGASASSRSARAVTATRASAPRSPAARSATAGPTASSS